MNISGTLHLYSGKRRELFFVFDDDVAQELYSIDEFEFKDKETRRAYISVGAQRFIKRGTLSFSQKQTEIKVSLCAYGSKEGLGTLTDLYSWFLSQADRPPPFPVLGTLSKSQHQGTSVWELKLTEPIELEAVDPPGLARRSKAAPPERRSFEMRRIFAERDTRRIGRVAEKLALQLAAFDFPLPEFTCHWRDKYLDSEKIEVRKMGIIADIDIWNVESNTPQAFLEIKAQKIQGLNSDPAFYLSVAEWRSYERAQAEDIPYELWLFQYRDIADFDTNRHRIKLVIFTALRSQWLAADGYLVTPGSASGTFYELS